MVIINTLQRDTGRGDERLLPQKGKAARTIRTHDMYDPGLDASPCTPRTIPERLRAFVDS